MAYGKVTSKVVHTVQGVVRGVKEVVGENGVSYLHTLEPAYEEFEKDKKDRDYLNWQFWTRGKDGQSAIVYDEGSVITLMFKYFKITPSQDGRSFYLVPQFPRIERLDWVTVEKKEWDSATPSTHDNKKNTDKPDATPEPVTADDDEDF